MVVLKNLRSATSDSISSFHLANDILNIFRIAAGGDLAQERHGRAGGRAEVRPAAADGDAAGRGSRQGRAAQQRGAVLDGQLAGREAAGHGAGAIAGTLVPGESAAAFDHRRGARVGGVFEDVA